MPRPVTLAVTAAGLALLTPAPALAYVQTPATADGWFEGRATFFGAPQAFADSFKDRGEGAFGDLLWGSCGYFNKPQVMMRTGGERERRRQRAARAGSGARRAGKPPRAGRRGLIPRCPWAGNPSAHRRSHPDGR